MLAGLPLLSNWRRLQQLGGPMMAARPQLPGAATSTLASLRAVPQQGATAFNALRTATPAMAGALPQFRATVSTFRSLDRWIQSLLPSTAQAQQLRQWPGRVVQKARQTFATPQAVVAGTLGAMAGVMAGDKNQAIMQALRTFFGQSSREGPDGGNLACAWMVNRVLRSSVGTQVGDNPNYVPSVEADLKRGKGRRVPVNQAQPGDIVISGDTGHIGFYIGNGKVLSNSSSRAAFSYISDMRMGRSGEPRVYRLA